ncbi:MAG: DUF1501 domain-containing protein [bacterium]|nr:DUF1501 domain-containing protein [bacterium]
MLLTDRRDLLRGGLSLAGSLAFTSPSALAAGRFLGERPGRRAVVIQLSGGNDGLSAVVPYADDAYGAARKATRVPAKSVLRLDDYRGLHPNLKRMRKLWDAGGLAIVEGVGYPDAPRSHFKSLEVWHTARADGRSSGDGWLGRLDASAFSAAARSSTVVHVGREAPYSVYSIARPAISLESPTGYKWLGAADEAVAYRMAGERLDEKREATSSRNSGRDAAIRRLRGLLDDANESSAQIRGAVARYRTPVEYPRTALGAGLHDIAAMIHSGLGARVFSTTLGKFDTHAQQKNRHDGLMQVLDLALGSFVQDLARTEAGRDTAVIVFSEFGRRVKENASAGTDHGKAGPVFVVGAGVKGGLYGEHPSLTELDEGDLAFTTDFRSVYSALVGDWFGADASVVLGGEYAGLPLFG